MGAQTERREGQVSRTGLTSSFKHYSAARKNVSGFISAGPTVFWNVEKK
jgi:hypothetical protein